MKEILFRCNVSPKTGTGHIRRCLVLAEEIKKLGGQVYFLIKSKDVDLKGLLSHAVENWQVINWDISAEEELRALIHIYTERNISALVVDHYEADSFYQKRLFNSGIKWLQFDGCSGRPLWANWVLNPSLAYRTCEYDRLIRREETQLLLGPKYAFLRKEFSAYKGKIGFRSVPEKILITMGGGDDRGAIIFCLNVLNGLENRYECVVLTTSNNPRNAEILNWVADSPMHVNVMIDEPNVAKRMVEADIGIVAGGMTTFETAAMGLPCLIIQIVKNQKGNAAAWDKSGVAIDMGCLDQLKENTLRNKIIELMDENDKRKLMHTRGISMVDFQAAARVAKLILGIKGYNKRGL